MKDVLALDLGTNSIGWAIREPHLLESEQFTNYGVRIFSKGVGEEKKVEFSLATVRTQKRSLRKIYRRRRTRKIRLLRLLIEYGMCPLTNEDLKKWGVPAKSTSPVFPTSELFEEWLGLNPYELRAKAADPTQKLIPYEIGRAFYHLCQRRGFKSNVEEEATGDEDKQITPKDVQIYEAWIAENQGKTLGQALHEILSESKTNGTYACVRGRVNNRDNNDENKAGAESDSPGNAYSTRQLYKDEFWAICKAQGIEESLSRKIHDEIFFQRPLKSQKGTVGKCKLEPRKTRSHISHPDYEEFRMWQFINNIKCRPTGEPRDNGIPLTTEMKALILPKFYRKSAPSFLFSDLSSTINKTTSKKYGVDYDFNFSPHTSVAGNYTCARLQEFLGEDWQTFKKAYQPKDIDGDKKIGSITYEDIWHIWLSIDKEEGFEKLTSFGKQRLGLTEDKKVDSFSKVRLKKGYADLSLKAIRKILPFLKEGMIFSHAVFMANLPEVLGKVIWNEHGKELPAAIAEIVAENEEIRKMNEAVNAAISYFNIHYKNAAVGYQLDEKDKEDINESLVRQFGHKSWLDFGASKRKELQEKAYSLYEKQLSEGFQTARFLKHSTIEQQIKTFLADHFGVEEEQLAKLYHPSVIEVFDPPKEMNGIMVPGSPRTPSVRNPMAMRTLHELRYLLKELFQRKIIDSKTVVAIEMARELNDANKRAAIERTQRERDKENKDYLKEITKYFESEKMRLPDNTDDLILRYRLWKEQKEMCLYTSPPHNAINLADLFNGNIVDVEHTFPRSKTNDNSLANLTVCFSDYNRNIKKNQSPFELYEKNYLDKAALLQRVKHWKYEIEQLEKRIFRLNAPRGYEGKKQKDDRIRMRHYLRMKLDYLKDKYNRFTATEIRSGFARRQLVDTGVITKYALAYLRSMFENVRAVKGNVVAEYRKAWGLQEEYEKKSRDSHLHHLVDAIVIAMLDRHKYDLMAQLYAAEEKMDRREENELKKGLIPWTGFEKNVKSLIGNVLISHAYRSNFEKQTKKKLRQGGKIVKSKTGEPVYQQGQGVRARLHEETFYGAIRIPGTENITYVIRKSIANLATKDYEKIVDKKLRDDFVNGNYIVIPEEGKAWPKYQDGTPDRSKLPITKVRIMSGERNPIKLKQQSHRRKGTRHDYKETYYVANEGNYEMFIFYREHNGKIIRKIACINYLDASGIYIKNEAFDPFALRADLQGYTLFGKVKIGQSVIFYENHPDEIQWEDKTDLNKRLYHIYGIEADRLKLKFHLEARDDKALKEDLMIKLGGAYEENWVRGKPKFEYSACYPRLRISGPSFSFQLEGTHFRITPSGLILQI